MDKILVEIIDPTENAVQIDSEKLTRNISKDGLSIDEEKLYGSDNFIIDARRLKCTVNLVNNSSINDILRSKLTDETLLIRDNIETESFQCIVFDKQHFLDETSFDKLFIRDYLEVQHTWDTVYPNYLLLESTRMLLMIKSLVSIISWYQWDNNIDASMEECRRLSAFIFRTLAKSATVTGSPTITQLITSSLSNLIPWVAVDSRFPVLVQKVINFTTAYYFIGDLVTEYNSLASQIYLMRDVFIGFEDRVQTISGSTEHSYYTNNIDPSSNSNISALLISGFFASIIKKEYYMEFVNDYIRNMYNAETLTQSIFAKHGGQTTIEYFSYVPSWGTKAFQNGINIVDVKQIKFVSKNQNRLIFGKAQTRSSAIDSNTQSGIPLSVNNDNIGYWEGLFVPVSRTFLYNYNTNNVYKFYLDNINSSIVSNPLSYLVTQGNSDINWLYFDNISCVERVLSDIEDILVDNYPVWDDEDTSQSNVYGLYVYEDFFDKFYTKTKSTLMNLYAKIWTISNAGERNLLYHGVIDYSTVEVNEKARTISFEATDAIGVLIENLNKLGEFVEFSQFDTGDTLTAEPKAGTTIKNFILDIIENPKPYNTLLGGNAINLDDISGINNKALDALSAEDAFMAGMQLSMKLLKTDSQGRIELIDWDIDSEPTTILVKDVYDFKREQSRNDVFDAKNIKQIAGFDKIAPEVASYFNNLFVKNRKTVTVVVPISYSTISTMSRFNIEDSDMFNSADEYVVIEKQVDIIKKQVTLKGVLHV